MAAEVLESPTFSLVHHSLYRTAAPSTFDIYLLGPWLEAKGHKPWVSTAQKYLARLTWGYGSSDPSILSHKGMSNNVHTTHGFPVMFRQLIGAPNTISGLVIVVMLVGTLTLPARHWAVPQLGQQRGWTVDSESHPE